MKTLISGSIAFDTVFVFEDHFKNHILPDQIHILNVSFFAPKMQRFSGGCAGNIAYNLKLLGGEPVMMGTVGEDFGAYAGQLDDMGLSREHVRMVEGEFTAQCFITTDADNNQLNAFHPGAMNFAHYNKVDDASNIGLGIVAPNGRDAMLQHAHQFADSNIPFFFDPGQQLQMFDGAELLSFCDQATYLVVNDYECQVVMDKTGASLEHLIERVDALIVTRGGEGSRVYTGGEKIEIPTAPIEHNQDPTGCGDAYRAGLLYGVANNLGWQQSGRLGALCGAIKIEHHGTQNHKFTLPEFKDRYESAFGKTCPIG